MPRIAEQRKPVLPNSPGQEDRYRRILRSAARHGAAHGMEGMQMHDVARDAGVAIATVYRYFPSKTYLLTALMRSQVDRLREIASPPAEGQSPDESLSELLNGAAGELLARPLLAQAIMQANNAVVAESGDGETSSRVFSEVMMVAIGIDAPSDHDLRLLRILEQAWYGIVMSALNGHVSAEELRADTVLMCRLLLAGRDDPPETP